jgi:hypothetical protein
MELFHNQVTREQGLFSLRFHHPSFGLHFLAENVQVPTTVLDFPSQARFIQELKKGYDLVGISFIVPNFVKAQRMAQLVRRYSPKSKILLGGHGTRIPGLEAQIEHDHICRGEGVAWLRALLGEDSTAPLRHPMVPSAQSKRILGMPIKSDAAVLIPGVGCPNACRFCTTSHSFDKKYTAFYDSGADLYAICRAAEAKLGVREFFVMDENFLKRPERARQLLRRMEEEQRLYRFGIFSSAETITRVGVEFLARLGVYFVWIGVESKQEVYEKNRGIDLKRLIRELRDHGISVLASGILFLEQHDQTTIWQDIRYLVDLEPDLAQFMGLGPLPGTALFESYDAQNLLRKDVPWEECHGQHEIWFHHPHFTPADSSRVLRAAFRHDYDTLGSSLLRMCDTVIRGLETLGRYSDPVMIERRDQLYQQASMYRPALRALSVLAHSGHVRALTAEVAEKFDHALGPISWKDRILSRAILLGAKRERRRIAAGKHIYQPKTIYTTYHDALLRRHRRPAPGEMAVPSLQFVTEGRVPTAAVGGSSPP